MRKFKDIKNLYDKAKADKEAKEAAFDASMKKNAERLRDFADRLMNYLEWPTDLWLYETATKGSFAPAFFFARGETGPCCNIRVTLSADPREGQDFSICLIVDDSRTMISAAHQRWSLDHPNEVVQAMERIGDAINGKFVEGIGRLPT